MSKTKILTFLLILFTSLASFANTKGAIRVSAIFDGDEFYQKNGDGTYVSVAQGVVPVLLVERLATADSLRSEEVLETIVMDQIISKDSSVKIKLLDSKRAHVYDGRLNVDSEVDIDIIREHTGNFKRLILRGSDFEALYADAYEALGLKVMKKFNISVNGDSIFKMDLNTSDMTCKRAEVSGNKGLLCKQHIEFEMIVIAD